MGTRTGIKTHPARAAEICRVETASVGGGRGGRGWQKACFTARVSVNTNETTHVFCIRRESGRIAGRAGTGRTTNEHASYIKPTGEHATPVPLMCADTTRYEEIRYASAGRRDGEGVSRLVRRTRNDEASTEQLVLCHTTPCWRSKADSKLRARGQARPSDDVAHQKRQDYTQRTYHFRMKAAADVDRSYLPHHQ